MCEALKKKDQQLTFYVFSLSLRGAQSKRWRFHLINGRASFNFGNLLQNWWYMYPHEWIFSLPFDISDQRLFQIRNLLANPRTDLSFWNVLSSSGSFLFWKYHVEPSANCFGSESVQNELQQLFRLKFWSSQTNKKSITNRANRIAQC